jgi:hypothetical protein
MPYNPGVSDRRGEIFASSITFAEDLRRMDENERKRRTAAGQVQGMLAANPQLAQMADPALMQKLGMGKANLNDTLQLLGTLSTVQQQEQEKQQAKLREVQMQAAMMQQQAHQQQILASQRAQQGEQDLNARLDQMLSGSNTNGVLTPQAQAAMAQLAQSPAGQLRKQGVRMTPDMMSDLARAEIAHAPKAAPPMPGSAGYKTKEFGELGTMVIDVATGKPVDSGSLVRPHEKKSDEKSLTATEIQQLSSLQQAGRDLAMLEERFASYKDPNWGGPIAGPAKALLGMGTNPRIAEIENLVTSATPNLARGVFREVGVLTDDDVKRYRTLLPNVNDTAEIRAKKLADLKSRLGTTLDETLATLQAAGRDVSGLREKVRVDKAAKPSASGAPAPTSPGKIPEFSAPAEVETAINEGRLQRGAIVRVGGKLFRAQ